MSRECKSVIGRAVPSALKSWFNHRKTTRVVDFVGQYHRTDKRAMANKLAYLAGLIDGEGTIGVAPSGSLRLRIGMTDRKTVHWLHHTFGGTFSISRTAKGRPFYLWSMHNGRDLFYLFLLTIPFLVTKRKRAVEALSRMIGIYEQMYFSLKSGRRELPCRT